MSPLTRPGSPIQTDNRPQIAQSHDIVQPPPRTPSFSHLSQQDMGHPKTRSHLEIFLDSQYITLKGTGVDVEPARLSGHLVLHLSEDTPIKELTLQFRGKSRIPTTPSESLVASNTSLITNVIYNHEWSFLEGDRKHVRTVKAGRHTFPFHLQIDGSFPSSLSTPALGGSSLYYKLRAVAVRPGLNYNLQTDLPVQIDRSLGHEALEYQQSLEVEGTWKDKLMYSVMLPHKAWAAGDQLLAILKISPTSKGVFVTQVRTVVQETTKTHGRAGVQEDVRTAACARHNIIGGKPVFVDPLNPYALNNPANASQSQNAIAGPSTATTSGLTPSSSRGSPTRSFSFSSLQTSPVIPSTPSVYSPELNPEDNNDVVLTIPIKLPPYSSIPSHSMEPIVISHRIRWYITLRNLDGHASELRCSLPLHILHHRFLEEARSFSMPTRRLLLGSSELPPDDNEEDHDLPSYGAHIRDRVANMFLPDSATVRVNNPWINRSSIPPTPHLIESGYSTPLEPHTASLSHLPHAPSGPEGIATLNLLNSELLVSLSDSPLRRRQSSTSEITHTTPPVHTPHDSSPLHSRNHSQPHSRHNSRPPSPDHHDDHHHHHHHPHSRGHSRDFRHMLRATIRPFTSFNQHHHHPRPAPPSRHDSHHDDHSHSDQQQPPQEQGSNSNSTSPHLPAVNAAVPEHMDEAELLHRAFTEVPDYSIASRGFIGGGVPPLESMRGLPSYEEAARERSGGGGVARREETQLSDLDVVVEGVSGISIADGNGGGQERGVER